MTEVGGQQQQQEVVSVDDICADLKAFEVEVVKICSYVKDTLSEPRGNNIMMTCGFRTHESAKVYRFTKDDKSFLLLKLRLLKGAIESVIGERFQSHCIVKPDMVFGGYVWNISIETKNNPKVVFKDFRISL